MINVYSSIIYSCISKFLAGLPKNSHVAIFAVTSPLTFIYIYLQIFLTYPPNKFYVPVSKYVITSEAEIKK